MKGPLAPPPQLAPFVDVLGVDGAVSFLLQFGGADLYIARNPQSRGRLTQAIGVEATKALAEMVLPRRIPTGKPWIARVMHARGLPVAEIARTLHVTDVSVRSWLREPAADGSGDARQLPLI